MISSRICSLSRLKPRQFVINPLIHRFVKTIFIFGIIFFFLTLFTRSEIDTQSYRHSISLFRMASKKGDFVAFLCVRFLDFLWWQIIKFWSWCLISDSGGGPFSCILFQKPSFYTLKNKSFSKQNVLCYASSMVFTLPFTKLGAKIAKITVSKSVFLLYTLIFLLNLLGLIFHAKIRSADDMILWLWWLICAPAFRTKRRCLNLSTFSSSLR